MEYKLNIERARANADLTQSELATALGLKSASTVSMWENGCRTPSGDMIPRIADALRCAVDELYEGLSPAPAEVSEPVPSPAPSAPRPGWMTWDPNDHIADLSDEERRRRVTEFMKHVQQATPEDGELS